MRRNATGVIAIVCHIYHTYILTYVFDYDYNYCDLDWSPQRRPADVAVRMLIYWLKDFTSAYVRMGGHPL